MSDRTPFPMILNGPAPLRDWDDDDRVMVVGPDKGVGLVSTGGPIPAGQLGEGSVARSVVDELLDRTVSAKHASKQKLFKSQSSSAGGVVGTTVTDLFTAAVGTNMIKKDLITFRLSGRGEGTNGTKSIHCFFRNNTDSSDFDIFTHSFIAAFAGSTIGKFIIQGWIHWNDQVTYYVDVMEVTGSVHTYYSGYSTMPTAAKDLTFKIQFYGATATEGVTFHCAKVDYENVFYGR